MKTRIFIVVLTASFAVSVASPAYAIKNQSEAKFNSLMTKSLNQLSLAAAKVLRETYPDESWEDYQFPHYVYNDLETEVAYKVAVKNHRLLGIANIRNEEIVIPCYCTCDTFGHDNLLYCFFKNGVPEEGFDEHGAQCAVCLRQALLAFFVE